MRALLVAVCLALLPALAQAVEYTADDSLEAIHEAATNHGVSEAALKRVASCETHGSFDPYAVGDGGSSFGLFQLHHGGLLEVFYAAGFDNPMDPYQAASFTGGVLGGEYPGVTMRHWSCW